MLRLEQRDAFHTERRGDESDLLPKSAANLTQVYLDRTTEHMDRVIGMRAEAGSLEN